MAAAAAPSLIPTASAGPALIPPQAIDPSATNPPPTSTAPLSSVPTSPSLNFPSGTGAAAGVPATGGAPSLVPTVGSTDQTGSPNTPIPGLTAGPSSNSAASGTIPNAKAVPAGNAPTIAPVNPSALVSQQLTQDLASGSPIMQLARSQALQQSAARGLQNSSLAVGAGETAAIGSMLPVAQQDASTTAAAQTANLAALNTSALATQQGEITQKTQAAQISEQLQATLQAQAQQGQINFTLQAQTEAANINQILTQGTVNSMLSKQQSDQQIQQINQTSLDTINQINAQASATASQDGPALQAQYLTGVTNIMTATQAQIQAIYNTQGLTADQQQAAVLSANQQMQENIQNLAAYYASSPLWDTGQSPAGIPGSQAIGAPAQGGTTGGVIPRIPAPTLIPPTQGQPTPAAPVVAPAIPQTGSYTDSSGNTYVNGVQTNLAQGS